MSIQEQSYRDRHGGLSQCKAILLELVANAGHWVSRPRLARVSGAAAVNSRIAELRRRGHRITNESTLPHNGKVKSRYKLEVV